MTEIHPGVLSDFQIYLDTTRAQKQRYVVENGKLRRCSEPILDWTSNLYAKSKRRCDELRRTHQWSSSRCCFLFEDKEVVLVQDILQVILKHYVPAQPAFRDLHDEISKVCVGVSRTDCKEALRLFRKHDWHPTSDQLAWNSTSIRPVEGREMDRWSDGYLEQVHRRGTRRYQTTEMNRNYVRTASPLIPMSLHEPSDDANIIYTSEEELYIAMQDPHYQMPGKPFYYHGRKDDLLDEDTFWRRLLQRPDDRIECQDVEGLADERYQTLMLSPAKAVERFRSNNRDTPINMLSLRGRPDQVSRLKMIYENCVLHEFRNDYNPGIASHHPGKPTVVQRDLANCDSFMVAGGEFSISDIHFDQSGVITVIRCEFGLKQWLFWAPSDLEDVQKGIFQWERHPHYILYLQPGTVIVMPPLTAHGPSSLRRTVLTGFMIFRKSMMRRHMEAIVWLDDNPGWSNENQAQELLPELYRIVRAVVAEQEDPGIWGSEEDRFVFVDLAKAHTL